MPPDLKKLLVMPTKSKPRLLISFCLSSLIPILTGVYIGSLFVKYPFELNPLSLMTISLILLFSMFLSLLGYQINHQLVIPILEASHAAKKIASGELEETPILGGSDELKDLSQSLRVISENARELLEKVETLSLKDKLTGLYKTTYIQERLGEEIQRSIHYQRPCSFVYFHIESLGVYISQHGEGASEDLLKSVAGILNGHLSKFDRAARINLSDFALIFTDRNKKSAIEKTESIVLEIKEFLAKKTLNGKKEFLRVFAGVSENPLDGVIADELYVKAQDRMRLAKEKGTHSVEAFA